MAEPTIEWNHYRCAIVELGPYLLMNDEPTGQRRAGGLRGVELCGDMLPESETSMSSSDDLPVYLYTPRPLPIIQQLKNWWRYR
ncbi:hypothetical protein VP01_562g2 [Puccinia sorghi]|uniref:Uncharacterized protein n=1 Tax=Puccinia sorghi TaxID=27349 RepID=A0A0L6UL04_9BASI|nr:hypothetical protein VP01_562g2 [Puccinia sorghi]